MTYSNDKDLLPKEGLTYFINLSDHLVCVNFIRTNGLVSPSLYHMITYKEEYPLYNSDLKKLVTDLEYEPIGFASPRLAILKYSKVANNGYKLAQGEEVPVKWLPDNVVNRYHKIAQLEVEFERIRRLIAPNAASRLSAIFLAADNLDGRLMLQNMFNSFTSFLIAPIEVKYIHRIHKADSKWIAHYEQSPSEQLILSYWLGAPSDNEPQYEYLIEGIVQLKNLEDREHIKSETSKIHPWIVI
ncbi:hypothetical protein [Rubrolithibacter danxiaensis]|uniref:hypothetical protein n=1 Tax=Rubrolithibacter danxiaensis TaxID=3390805 RepID=UPI003BF7C645